jgi:hypothetical protein
MHGLWHVIRSFLASCIGRNAPFSTDRRTFDSMREFAVVAWPSAWGTRVRRSSPAAVTCLRSSCRSGEVYCRPNLGEVLLLSGYASPRRCR